MIFIDFIDGVARTGIYEDDRLIELFVDDSWVGHIILGRLKTILPNNFGFVDIGTPNNAFMNLAPGHGLKAGTNIVVQVLKDAVGKKSMNVDTRLALKGRYVILSQQPMRSVSKKIADTANAHKLYKLTAHKYGVIIRTAAAGVDLDIIKSEIDKLAAVLDAIPAAAEYERPPKRLYPTETPIPHLVDILAGDVHLFSDEFEKVRDYINSIDSRVTVHRAADPFFPRVKLKKVLENVKTLPCGGSINIVPTEACVVIDVNSGSNVGKKDYESATLATNMNAAAEICRQLRLKNLSGIIIIDFINMKEPSSKNTLLHEITTLSALDRVPVNVVGWMNFDMMGLTRKRTRPPLAEMLQTVCTVCKGSGRVRV